MAARMLPFAGVMFGVVNRASQYCLDYEKLKVREGSHSKRLLHHTVSACLFACCAYYELLVSFLCTCAIIHVA